MAAVAVVILAAVVLLRGSPFEPTTETPQDTIITTNNPDIEATDVQFRQLHPDGSLHYRLHAAHITQFEEDQMTRMNAPKLHLTSIEQPPWDIKSNRGFIDKKLSPEGVEEDVVYLHQDVEMVQLHPTSGLVTLRSETFYIYPDRQFAETNQSVMIDTEVGRTRAAGMVADMKSGLLRLSSNSKQRVHTIVLPEQFKNTKSNPS